MVNRGGQAVQAALAGAKYVTLSDLADRWDTPESARAKSPLALGFDGVGIPATLCLGIRGWKALGRAKVSWST